MSCQVFVVRLADPAERALREILEQFGIAGHRDPRYRRHADNLLTVGVTDPAPDLAARVTTHPAVDRVFALGTSRLYSRWPNGEPDPVRLHNGTVFGGPEPVVIAGPCSIEGPRQILEISAAVADAGAKVLRGGVFKPRSSPYDFGGLGEDGLLMMARAGKRAGLPIITEVLDHTCMDLVAQHADILQIGSRNMHNTSFLFALGAHPRGKPALLKRGFGATVEELLNAAEYFLLGRLAAGHASPGLILCERGMRTFENATRFTLDVAAIPVLQRRTHLPVIADPSHPAGDRELVAPLAAAAIAAGAHGLIVEVHTDPARAWCDGPQSLTPAMFRDMMAGLATLRSTPVQTASTATGTARSPEVVR